MTISTGPQTKAIQAAESLSPSLDQEGGAKATNPKSRYVTTGISVSLALVGSGGKNDVGNAGPAAGGATALKLVGIAVGLAVRSHTLAILMSAYGGSRSIYTNFFGRGRNISFPRHLDGDRLRRSNRNSNAGPPLTVSVPDFAKRDRSQPSRFVKQPRIGDDVHRFGLF